MTLVVERCYYWFTCSHQLVNTELLKVAAERYFPLPEGLYSFTSDELLKCPFGFFTTPVENGWTRV